MLVSWISRFGESRAGGRGLLLLVALSVASLAAADSYEWTGTATNAYEDGASWLNTTTATSGQVPLAADTATFNVADSLTLGADHSLAGLDIVSGGTSLASLDANLRTLTVTQPNGGTSAAVNIEGATAGDMPDLTVGAGVTLIATSDGPLPATLLVGDVNHGSLTITGGGAVVSAQNSLVGHSATGTGNVLVSGDNSRWSTSQMLILGSSGTGNLTIEAGGDVFPTQLVVADGSGSSGTVNIQGTGSLLSTLLLDIGSQGTGNVNITENSRLEVNGPLRIKQGGDVIVDGGTLFAGSDVTLTAGGNLNGENATNFLLASNKKLTATGSSTVNFDTYTVADGTTFDLKTSSKLTAGELHIGNTTSQGTLNVNDLGTLVDLTSLTNPSQIGSANPSTGLTTVNLATNGLLRAAAGGLVLETSASINITSGADLRTSGPFTMHGGKVNLSGKGSMLQLTNGAPMTIGGTGPATLTLLASSIVRTSSAGVTIGEGGTLTAAGAGPGGDRSFVFADGPLVVDGGTVQIGNFADLFLLGGNTFTARNNAKVDFGDSQPITAGKTYTVESGASLASEALPISNGGALNLSGGAIIATTLDNSQGGEFDFTGGRLSATQFVGSLLNQGGTLAPGDGLNESASGSTSITENLVQQAAATLTVDIAGLSPGTQYDQVIVSGSATLKGGFEVSLLDGFTPTPTDTFTVLTADSIAGGFGESPSGSRVITQDGLGSFQIDYGVGSPFAAGDVVLSDFIAMIAGDFNDDGTVDAADFAVWRDNVGAVDETALSGNGNGDGIIDAGDYQLWQTHFGLTTPTSLRAGSSAVPEPSSLVLLSVLLSAAFVHPKRT